MVEKSLVGKKVKLFFDDGEKVRYKEGIILEFNEIYITINTIDGIERIATSRFIRVEELKKGVKNNGKP